MASSRFPRPPGGTTISTRCGKSRSTASALCLPLYRLIACAQAILAGFTGRAQQRGGGASETQPHERHIRRQSRAHNQQKKQSLCPSRASISHERLAAPHISRQHVVAFDPVHLVLPPHTAGLSHHHLANDWYVSRA